MLWRHPQKSIVVFPGVFVLACLQACVPTPAAAPVAYTATDIDASFGRTWDAVIDEFARKTIPIKTIDRTSGLIATDALKIGDSAAASADCGKDFAGVAARPTDATYNVLVRGDSTHSTVRVTVRWVRIGQSRDMGNTSIVTEDCSTRSTWEMSLQQAIKQAAEAKRP